MSGMLTPATWTRYSLLTSTAQNAALVADIGTTKPSATVTTAREGSSAGVAPAMLSNS